MNIMDVVSETALITLKARALESEKPDPIIQDVVSKQCLDSIKLHLPADIRKPK